MLINCKGTKNKFTKRSLTDPTLIKPSRWISLVTGQTEIMCHLIGGNERNIASLL